MKNTQQAICVFFALMSVCFAGWNADNWKYKFPPREEEPHFITSPEPKEHFKTEDLPKSCFWKLFEQTYFWS